MLEPDLLLKFSSTFFGYGDLLAPIWFIGMEEAGGGQDEIRKRFETWSARGRKQIEDLAGFHEALGLTHLTAREDVKLQPTWIRPIRFQLAASGQVPDIQSVRTFQKSVWGRHSSRTCLLELMPLPKRSATSWMYNEWTNIPELWSRSLYFAHFAAKRAERLKVLLGDNRPRVVVFFGKSPEFACHWPWIAGVRPQDWIKRANWHQCDWNGTRFIIVAHPTATGSKDEVWDAMGKSVLDIV